MVVPGNGIEQIIHQYGAPGLFVLLAIGIFGLPVPDETLLTISGYLISIHQESYLPVALAAFGGSSLGITVSYVIGHYPVHKLIEKYGSWVHLTQERYEKVHAWFGKWGKPVLTFGYYVPGFRHITAIAAGASDMPFIQFAIYAWSGALIWSNTFILLGYYTGQEWPHILAVLHKPVVWVVIGICVIIAAVLIYRYWKSSRES